MLNQINNSYGDIRKIGSGNIGATNVLRTGNKWLALLTVILDASKAGLIADENGNLKHAFGGLLKQSILHPKLFEKQKADKSKDAR